MRSGTLALVGMVAKPVATATNAMRRRVRTFMFWGSLRALGGRAISRASGVILRALAGTLDGKVAQELLRGQQDGQEHESV